MKLFLKILKLMVEFDLSFLKKSRDFSYVVKVNTNHDVIIVCDV